MKLLKQEKSKKPLKADDFRPDTKAHSKNESPAGMYVGPVVKSRWLLIKRVGILVSVIAVCALLIGLVAINLPMSRTSVCKDPATLKKYNQAVRSVDKYADSVKELAQEIESDENYTKDITCTYMVYARYASSQDAGKSRELLEVMKVLYKDGARINKDLIDQKSLQKEEEYVKLLEYSRDLKDGGEGRG